MDPEIARHRSRKALAHRRGDPAAIESSARDLAVAKLRAYITRTVAVAPPLTPDQRETLAALLNSGGAP